MLNFAMGDDCAGLEIGGNILDEAVAVKLPLTSCSNDPRIESELPSEFPSLVSDLLPTLLSLLPLCEGPVSMLGAFRNLGLRFTADFTFFIATLRRPRLHVRSFQEPW